MDFASGRCRQCGAVYFPHRSICGKCWAQDVELVEVTSQGRVETWTTVHRAPPDFTAPYTLAKAAFLFEGVRVLARLETSIPPVVGVAVVLRHGVDGMRSLSLVQAPDGGSE